MHSGLSAALRLLMVMVAALLPAACGARPAPPTALSDVPSATAAAATPPAVATGAPTVPPQVRVAVGESMPGAPTAGARPWRVRVWPAEELATRLGAVAAGSVLLADAEGQVRAWTDGAAWWPGVGPAGFAWDADHRLWRRQETVWLPDVVLPGGWSGDEKTGFAGPLLEAEAVFLLKDPEGNYRVAVYYAQEKIQALGIEPPNFLAERRAADPQKNQVFDLPNGDVVYLSSPKTEALAEGEKIERLSNGDLVKTFKDGSNLYWITSWANVQSPADVRFVGGFEGPIDQQSLGLASSLPPIPFAPPTMAPSDWQAKGYRYDFDREKTETILYDAKGQEIGRARYDQAQGKWVWEKVEPRYSFTPSSLTLEQAKNFLAGGEYLNPQQLQEQFAGRVFKEEKSGAIIVLSAAAEDILLSQIPADEMPGMSQEQIEAKLAEVVGKSEWARILGEVAAKKYPLFGEIVFASFSKYGSTPIIVTLKPDSPNNIAARKNVPGIPIEEVSRGYIYFLSNNNKLQFIAFEFPNREFNLAVNWSDKADAVVAYDSYQARWALEVLNVKSQPVWRPILPQERAQDPEKYKVLTPDQQIQYVLHLLKNERSAYHEPYQFEGYVTTSRPHQGVEIPEIIIAYGGKNGFTKAQAEAMRDWINQLLDQSAYAREVFKVADARFIVRDNEGLSQLIGPGGTKYGSAPNHFNHSVWGMDVATYYGEDWFRFAICGEIARIYNEQIGVGLGNEPEKEKIRDKLLAIAPPFKFPP